MRPPELLPTASSPAPRSFTGALGVAPRPAVAGVVPSGDALPTEPSAVDERARETRLMARFRDERCHRSFDELYRATRSAMVTWIAQLAAQRREPCDPLDVLQDTFVNIYRYAGSFRDESPGSFRRWARTIAANAMRRSRRRTASQGIALADLPETRQEPADPRTDPVRDADFEERRQGLARAWMLLLLNYAAAYAELSPRDQEALTLVEVEGLPYSEVGARLNVGRSNTKMIVFRARKRIRARILAALCGAAEPRRRAG